MSSAATIQSVPRRGLDRNVTIWLLIGLAAFVAVPWYGLERGYLDPRWITRGWPVAGPGASGLFASLEKPWLLPHLIFLLLPLATWGREKSDPLFARLLLIAGGGGLCWLLLQGFAIGLRGWQWSWLEPCSGPWNSASSAWAMARC